MTHFTTLRSTLKKIGWGLVAAAFWLAIWQLAYAVVAQEILLVSPVQAFMRLLFLAGEAPFWRAVAQTCLRVLAGFSAALVLGVVLAAAGARFALVRHLISPFMGVVRATPISSFIILALVWIVNDRVPVFIAFLMVVPMFWQNLTAGIASTDKDLLEMAKVFRFSRMKVFRYIYVPAVLPYFAAACSSGLGFAWKSAIAAEIISLPRASVGRQIYNSKIYLETTDLFAWTMAVILLSLLIERIALWLLRLLGRKLGGGQLPKGGESYSIDF